MRLGQFDDVVALVQRDKVGHGKHVWDHGHRLHHQIGRIIQQVFDHPLVPHLDGRPDPLPALVDENQLLQPVQILNHPPLVVEHPPRLRHGKCCPDLERCLDFRPKGAQGGGRDHTLDHTRRAPVDIGRHLECLVRPGNRVKAHHMVPTQRVRRGVHPVLCQSTAVTGLPRPPLLLLGSRSAENPRHAFQLSGRRRGNSRNRRCSGRCHRDSVAFGPYFGVGNRPQVGVCRLRGRRVGYAPLSVLGLVRCLVGRARKEPEIKRVPH